MADIPIDLSETNASESSRQLSADPLPSNFVRYAYQSETRLFLLAAAAKALWSICVLGINVSLLEITDSKDERRRFDFILVFLGVCLVYVCADIACNYYSALMGSRVMSRLAARIAEHAILNGSPEASDRSLALALTSSDTQSVCQGLITFFDLAVAPFWFVFVCILLGYYSSPLMSFNQMLQFCAIAAFLAVVFGGLMMFISILLTRAKKAINAAESKQVSIFVECLENIRTFRFYGWDSHMLQKLHRMTDDMLPLRQRLLRFKVINIAISFLASPIMCLILLMIYAATIGGTPGDMKMNINIYYAVVTMFDLIKFPLLLLPNAIRAASGASASYRRITDYFHRPTFEDKRQRGDVAGTLQLANFPVGPTSVLTQWRVEQGSLWILQGPVNSFKSTILESIAGHRRFVSSALLRVGGTMSYAPQVPWMQQATIKENIVCCEPWDAARFKSVIHACSLEPDFQQMTLGFETPVAEKGISLSGGQKQRVALARAAYRKADIYVLDNPISALDDSTQEFIWKHLIEGLLHDATIIIASSRPVISCTGICHLSPDGLRDSPFQMVSGFLPGSHVDDMQLLRYARNDAGAAKESSRLSTSHAPADLAGGCASAPVPRSRFNSVGKTVEEASVSDVSAAVREYENWLLRQEDDSSQNKRKGTSSLRHELLEAVVPNRLQIKRASFIQQLLEQNESMRGSYIQLPSSSHRSLRAGYDFANVPERSPAAAIAENSEDTGVGVLHDDGENFVSKSDLGIVQWATSMKLGKLIYLIPLAYIMYQAGRTYYFAYLLWWAEGLFGFSSETFVNIIFCIFTMMALARVSCDVLVYYAAINGAQRMRKNFCESIMNAPMTFFMSENLGPLVDVFTGDMSTVSEVLIDCFHYAIMYVLLVLGSMCFASSRFPYLVIISAALLAGCTWLQVVYRGRLKKVSLEFQKANNDVFHSVSDAIEGIKILRTANGTTWALDDLTSVLTVARIAVVTCEKCTIWLNVRSCALGLSVCFVMVFIAHFGISDPFARKIVTFQCSLYVIFLQWAMKYVGLGIYHLGSVERIHSYLQRIPREIRDGIPLDKAWPQQGDIELKNVCLRYAPQMPLALDGVSFKLPPASKVGVVGRTGSGKSTLLVALFRLINPCSGDMVVGGSSITNANVSSLREQMSIIPQEPVMFCGTLRENVDPMRQYSDFAVQEAINQAGLAGKALGTEVGVGGEGWSIGEKQLVCLARVLLKKPSVLFLDEATASLDEKTEAHFQKVLEEKFVDSTIFCIAHRLETLRWCRTRVEMGSGKLKSISSVPAPSSLNPKLSE